MLPAVFHDNCERREFVAVEVTQACGTSQSRTSLTFETKHPWFKAHQASCISAANTRHIGLLSPAMNRLSDHLILLILEQKSVGVAAELTEFFQLPSGAVLPSLDAGG